jgi:predicted lipid-binding transport protein (Tim44 family)
MGGFHGFDIILFALVAVFLVLRLRSVLGRRTGNERRRDLLVRRAVPTPDKVTSVAAPSKPALVPALGQPPFGGAPGGLERIHRADPTFDPDQFLAGARGAFEIVVDGFAKGDKAALRPLLSDEVYQPFSAAIDEREAAHETQETRIVGLDAKIVEAELTEGSAQVTVRFVSRQVNVTRSADGKVVEGGAEHPDEKTDYWTFAREIRSADPNWVLVATSSG